MGSTTTVPGDTNHILVLVRKALDEFDEKPLDVSIRRAVRIASLLGESKTAVRLAFELTSAAMRRRSVDLDAATVMINRTRGKGEHGALSEGPPKTARGRRTLDVDPETVLALRSPQAPDRRATRMGRGVHRLGLRVHSPGRTAVAP